MMRFTLANQKGGVGKTTLTLNIAGELSRNNDVLCVDLDPQGNLTEASGVPDQYHSNPPSLFDALLDASVRSSVNELIIPLDFGVDLLPSNIDMTAAEPELTMARRSAERLDLLLGEVDEEYDYILVDSPPFLGNLTDNALLSCENVIVPALAESTSTRAFELLFSHIEALESDFPEKEIGVIGVIANRVDVRKNEAKKMIENIQKGFDDIPVWAIRERADIQRSLANHKPLYLDAPDCDQNKIFQTITDYLEGLS